MSNTDFNSVFSRQLKYYLAINNMTQNELARKIGVGNTSVYNWCNGLKSPRMDKVDAMCKIFGCRRSDLMEEHNETTFSSTDYSNTATPEEFEKLVKPYRDLDFSGKKHIDYELNREAARVAALNGKDARIKELEASVSESATPNYLVLNAAHERTDIEQSAEDKLSDYDMMSDENF